MASTIQDQIAFWLGIDTDIEEKARGILLIAANHEVSTFVEFIPEDIQLEIKKGVASPPKSVDEILLLRSYNLRREAFAGLSDKQISKKLQENELQEKLRWFRALWRFHKHFYAQNA